MGKKTTFARLDIELTRRCNMACRHCYNGAAQDVDMTRERMDTLLGQTAEIGQLYIKGGETLLNVPALEYLIDQYQNLIYSICLKSVGNPFDAEDLTQEVFLSAYKSLAHFDGLYEKAWLSKIAVRKCLDFLKAAGRRSIPTEDIYFSQLPDLENHSSPEEQYLQSDSEQQVFRICSGLKSPYKEIAIAHFCKQMSVTEISQKEGKNPKTIQTQLYRAKNMLKKMLAERSD